MSYPPRYKSFLLSVGFALSVTFYLFECTIGNPHQQGYPEVPMALRGLRTGYRRSIDYSCILLGS